MGVRKEHVNIDDIEDQQAEVRILQTYYRALCDGYGKDSFQARFYLKTGDSWFPLQWSNEELEAELARPGNDWSPAMFQAFIAEEMGAR